MLPSTYLQIQKPRRKDAKETQRNPLFIFFA